MKNENKLYFKHIIVIYNNGEISNILPTFGACPADVIADAVLYLNIENVNNEFVLDIDGIQAVVSKDSNELEVIKDFYTKASPLVK